MQHMMTTLLLTVMLFGCRDKASSALDTGATDTIDPSTTDNDGDGYTADEDCDDENSVVSPGAAEICDGIDNDCDEEIDEGVTQTIYADDDGDGFGNSEDTVESCEIIDGYVATGTDCDDRSSASYPGAPEQCDDEDNDCDGEIDEDVLNDWYADADADGFGDPDSTYPTCNPPPGYVPDNTDCDDTDETAYPGGEEVCDNADNDCDDVVDEGVTTTYYQDIDGDGYGSSDKTTADCTLPTGYATAAGDCNPTDSEIYPGAVEVCDGQDNDCDGDADTDAINQETFYADSDSDGFGDPDSTATACTAPSGFIGSDGDCDDGNGAVNPDAEEICNGQDDDCDGDVDTDATDQQTWYADNDGDGYGGSSSALACSQPSGFADNADDCDDGEAQANPGETEICDAIDNDCDGSIDEGVTTTFYLDADEDGFGDPDRSTDACSQPSDYVADNTDCDDLDADSSPDGEEVCDGADNDCNELVDDGLDSTETFYADSDDDGYGDPDVATENCAQPDGYVTNSEDCDDLEEDINPDGEEVCDGADNDCSGTVDEGLAGSEAACAAESCAEILEDGASVGDGTYWLDPDGTGATEYTCDMTTDGGGWTQVLLWNREDDGDSQSDFEAILTRNINDMDDWTQGGSYIQWSDYDISGDVLDYEMDVIVPNDGEVLFDLDYYGTSMEQSGMWFYVTAAGSEEDLKCAAPSTTDSNNCFTGSYAGAYSSSDSAYLPSYTCSTTTSGDLSWDFSEQHDFSGDEVTTFHMTSFMCDISYGDYSRLYDMTLWVR